MEQRRMLFLRPLPGFVEKAGVEDEAGPHVDYYGGYSSVEAAS